MSNDWSSFVAFVARHRRFVVLTHVRPDGDALGSQMGLALALEALGKEAKCVIASSLPPRYAFLDREHRLTVHRPGDRYDGVTGCVVVDTGTFNQLDSTAEWVRLGGAETFVIDHHATQGDLGGQRLVDTSAEACGRLVVEAIDALGVPLSAEMARLLFVAVALDTGWFRHANTNAATFALCDRLVSAGAKPTPLYDELFERGTLARLRLTGRVLDRLHLSPDGKVGLAEVHLPDYAATGAIPLDTEDLINYPRGIAGVEAAVLLIEQPEGGVKISLRSRAVDVARVAEGFGGGGHRLAAGARVAGTLDAVRPQVLAALADALARLEPVVP